MKKTPRGENARLISNVHLEHDTRKIHKKFIRFSLDISSPTTYCKGRYQIFPVPACIATMPLGILLLTSEGVENG